MLFCWLPWTYGEIQLATLGLGLAFSLEEKKSEQNSNTKPKSNQVFWSGGSGEFLRTWRSSKGCNGVENEHLLQKKHFMISWLTVVSLSDQKRVKNMNLTWLDIKIFSELHPHIMYCSLIAFTEMMPVYTSRNICSFKVFLTLMDVFWYIVSHSDWTSYKGKTSEITPEGKRWKSLAM